MDEVSVLFVKPNFLEGRFDLTARYWSFSADIFAIGFKVAFFFDEVAYVL
jgi:hypothetical protein